MKYALSISFFFVAVALLPPLLAQTAPDETAKMQGGGDPLAGNRVRDLIETLSPDGRAIMVREIKAQQKANRPDSQKLREVRQRILDAMEAEKFDAVMLRRILVEERALTTQLQERRHESTISALQKMSDADRKLMSNNLRQIDGRARNRLKRLKEYRDKKRSNQTQ
jgi:uncharacterized membrane protein